MDSTSIEGRHGAFCSSWVVVFNESVIQALVVGDSSQRKHESGERTCVVSKRVPVNRRRPGANYRFSSLKTQPSHVDQPAAEPH